jgi:hypothetical protein
MARWDAYYAPADRKRNQLRTFCEFLEEHPDIAECWVRWYTTFPYSPRGAPDLFLWKRHTNSWAWIEVKSVGDNLQQTQWAWLEGFLTQVGGAVWIVRVLPAPAGVVVNRP